MRRNTKKSTGCQGHSRKGDDSEADDHHGYNMKGEHAIGQHKDEEQEEAMWRHTKDRIAQFEATSTRARLRTWISWTRWAKSRDIQPLEAAATLVQVPQRVRQERDGITLSGAQSISAKVRIIRVGVQHSRRQQNE